MAKHWIQKARESMEKRGTVGSLHKALGVAQGEKIPGSKLTKALHSKSAAIRKKAQFAANVKK